MSPTSLVNLPRELIYLIFQYLHKEDIAYSFLELNNYFSLAVKYFIGKQFDLTKITTNIIFQHCLSTVLPRIGSNLRYLSIDYTYRLSTYIEFIQIYCPNLDILTIYCCSNVEDIRRYASYLIHHQLVSLNLIYNSKIVGEQISLRLLDKSLDEQSQAIQISSSIIFHLSSLTDLYLLKRFSESNYLADGLYMIECLSTGEWLTDSKDDLCMTSKIHCESIFSIKQIDDEQCCLEYELYNQQTQRRLTVLISNEDEERWIPSSILSTHRKETSRSCSAFTFEKLHDENQFYIRPCYSRAKRLQVSGKRIIVSYCDNESTLNHRFRLHRIKLEYFFK